MRWLDGITDSMDVSLSSSKKLGLVKSSGRMETELWAWEDLFSWERLGVTWLNTC